MTNGYVPLGSMVPVANFAPIYSGVNAEIGSNRLMPATAAKLSNLQAGYSSAFHKPLPVVECYRPMVRQLATWQLSHAGGPLAAEPGDSPHGDGIAFDVGGPAGVFGTPEHAWLAANVARYGLALTVKSEAWHVQDLNPSTMPASVGTTIEVGDDDMPLNPDDKKFIRDTVIDVLRSTEFASVRNDQIAIQVAKRVPAAVWDYTTDDMPGKAWQVLRDTRIIARRFEESATAALGALKLALKIK